MTCIHTPIAGNRSLDPVFSLNGTFNLRANSITMEALSHHMNARARQNAMNTSVMVCPCVLVSITARTVTTTQAFATNK